LAADRLGIRAVDPMADFFGMHEFTQQFMSLWRSYKPTIARVHGPAVAGGSDIALCCDLVIMAEEAVIGYPPARGLPTRDVGLPTRRRARQAHAVLR
jgi:enoyl-CoA hydratase